MSLWQTPVYRANIGHSFPDAKRLLNDPLGEHISAEHDALLESNKERLGQLNAQSRNSVFFEWQIRGGGWGVVSDTPEWAPVSNFINATIDMYFKLLGKDEAYIAERGRDLTQWATVHKEHMSHEAHLHPGSVLSGVYYVKVPPGSGEISFFDPRGERPPFGTRYSVMPCEGDVILFPSWLVHEVSPTGGNQERISIAFNVPESFPGQWSDSNQVKDIRELHLDPKTGATRVDIYSSSPVFDSFASGKAAETSSTPAK